MWRREYGYQEQATDGTGAGAGAGGAGAGSGGTGAAGGGVPASGAGAGQGGAGTLLSAAAQAAGTGAAAGSQGQQAAGTSQAGADPFAAIPVKLHVKDAAGKIDPVATSAKVLEAYKQLETRMGSGDAPPEKPDGYKPDAVYAELKKASGKDVTLPPEFLTDFNKFAHAAQLSQGQYDKALSGMLAMTQGMVDQSFQHAMATGQAELEKVWGNDAKDPKSERMQNAYRAFTRFAPEKLRTPDVMDAIGSHPVVLQVLEAVGRELKPDRAPNEQGGQAQGPGRLDAIYADQAYWNARDPRHAALVTEAQALFNKGHKPTAMKGRGGTITL